MTQTFLIFVLAKFRNVLKPAPHRGIVVVLKANVEVSLTSLLSSPMYRKFLLED